MANYILLQSITLGAAAASVTFTNLPTSGYTDLKVTMSARGSASQEAGDFLLSLNGSTSNFTMRRLFTFQSTVYGDAGGGSFNYLGQYPGAVQTANTFGIAEFTIPNYRATKPTPINATSQDETNSTSALTYIGSNIWNDSSAISNFTISGNAGNFVAGSTFNVYGIAATGTTPANPKAIGGDIVINDGTYWYHAFLSTGTFTSTETLSCDILQIGSGGGGGSNRGGGGGAGGIRLFTSQSLVAGSYVAAVGAGGSGGGGTSGNASQFHNFTVSPGGGRGGNSQGAGLTGASGGGGGNELQSNPTPAGGSATLGNVGGTCDPSNKLTTGGGGGGFGGAGGNGSGSTGGSGGAGTNTYSAWATATLTGVSGFYAGGGGGYGSGGNGPGGSGGGGTGGAGTANNGSSGVIATGGGGGATNDSGVAYNGGSGLVIVRYAV